MSQIRLLARSMLLLLAVFGPRLAHGRATAADPRLAAIEREKAAPSDDAVQVATRWLDALRKHDLDALTRASRYPFALRDTRKEGHCAKSSAAPGPESLAATIDCLIKDDLLAEDLKSSPPLSIEGVSEKKLSTWTRPWRKEIGGGWQPVAISFYNDGDAWEFVLLVADGGVRAVWKTCKLANN
jgi:hypothetical protein